jgi:hypothetical protein
MCASIMQPDTLGITAHPARLVADPCGLYFGLNTLVASNPG